MVNKKQFELQDTKCFSFEKYEGKSEQSPIICETHVWITVNFVDGLQGEPSQSSELVAEAVKDSETPAADPGKVAAADSLLPIMHGQRERYRQRAQELETVSWWEGYNFWKTPKVLMD